MSKLTLVKMSSPGWEKDFDNVADFKVELWKHICGMCREGYCEEYEVECPESALHENSLIADMFSTSCGCEFSYEDPDGMLTPLS